MNGQTLITQPLGYPEERPETDDMDGMLDHLASELEGKQLLEKPRVSKKVDLIKLPARCLRKFVNLPLLVVVIVHAYTRSVMGTEDCGCLVVLL